MDTSNTVLIVATIGDAWSTLVNALASSHGYRVIHVKTFDEAAAVLRGAHVDLVIAERTTQDAACDFLAGLRASHPEVIRVLAFEGQHDDIARAAVYQFLRLPLDPEQAGLVVKRGLESRELARRHRRLSREFKLSDHNPPKLPQLPQASAQAARSLRFEKLVYISDQMADVCRQARIAARTDLPVLIQGETGTGKELLARAIHYNSQRRDSPLLVQNCAGVPDSLLQSELFGHRRGAFTGAISDRLGLFRAANGGTVFLDEISEVSPAFQISLLRFLQDGEIKPLGADQAVTSNIRIIVASNRPLKALATRGEFRRDLYYRLKGFALDLPPLRERRTDIPPLAELFAAKHGEELQRRTLGISARAIEKLVAYDWPGNVRELENEIRRLIVLTAGGEHVTTQHMSPQMLSSSRPETASRPGAARPSWNGQGKTLKDQVADLEKHLVHETLERCHWNQSKAAGELGLSRVGLANKIRRYRLVGA